MGRRSLWVAAGVLTLSLAAVPGRSIADAPGGAGQLADDPTLIALAVSLACAEAPDAAEAPPSGPETIAPAGPELELVATVRAKALRFDEVPKISIKFLGKTPRRTVWKTERVNLPVHPEPGVTYRDVAVRLTVTSSLDELSALLAQAKRASRGITLETDEAPAAAPTPVPAAAPTPVPAAAPSAPSAAPRAPAAPRPPAPPAPPAAPEAPAVPSP
jgi:hypothetical protein